MLPRGLTVKFFLAILATAIVVVVAMGVAARFTFNRGFVGYLNAQGEERMAALLPAFGAAYVEYDGWQCFERGSRLWFQLLRPRTAGEEERSDGPERRDARGCPQWRRGERAEGVDRDPAAADVTAARDAADDAARDARRSRNATRELPEPELTGLSQRLALLDAQQKLVIGNPLAARSGLQRPIRVAGNTVGWLALVPFQNASSGAGARFAQQQLRANWVIGGLAMLLAALVAFLLARLVTAPVKRVALGTRALAAGRLDARVPVESQDELGRLAEDFNRLAETLQSAEAKRRAFMADVSHELRTPLAVLKGELEALEDGVRPFDAGALRSLQGEAALLGKLVDDLYTLALADAGALAYRMAPCDLREVVERAADASRERMAAQGLVLELLLPDRPLPLTADEARLQQLLGNLLENSLRYTDGPGTVRLAAEAQDGVVRVVLEDSAPGVDEAARARLFERFFRAEGSRNRASGGAGLGLAICAKIVEAHGGSIAADDSPLGGLRVTVRLPRGGADVDGPAAGDTVVSARKLRARDVGEDASRSPER